MTKDSTTFNIDLIDQLLAGYKSPETVLGENKILSNSVKLPANARSKPNSLIYPQEVHLPCDRSKSARNQRSMLGCG